MKIVRIFFVLVLLTFAASADASSHPRHHHYYRPAIGAPLDGGILAVLGVAGVAYYAARKKKKNDPTA